MSKAFIDTSVILRLLVRDDDIKRKNAEKLIKGAKDKGITLHILPVAVMETVFVLEKVCKLQKKSIKDLVLALLSTPEIKVEMEDVFKNALKIYEEKNIKFADAVMGYWGLDKSISVIYTYDEKDFRRIEGLEVRRP